MKIKGVLFDLDGTLINTTPLILESFRHTFVEFGLPVPSEEALVAGFARKHDRRFLHCLQ